MKESVVTEIHLAHGIVVCFDSRRKMRRKMVRMKKKMKLMMVS